MLGEEIVTPDQLIQSRLGGAVERCHSIPHTGTYSVAAHSWGVAMLMHAIYPEDFPRLAIHCLSHDVPEGWVGDIPAPTMRYVPGLREALHRLEGDLNRSLGLPGEDELPPDDLAKLKACDRLELALWAREEMAKGNQYAGDCLKELQRYFSEQPLEARAAKFAVKLLALDPVPRQAGVVKALVERDKDCAFAS